MNLALPPDEPPDEGQSLEPFKFQSERQKRIYRRLHDLVAPGIAEFYHDACKLVSGSTSFRTTTHLVKHLLREIESAIMAILIPTTDRSRPIPTDPAIKTEEDNHRTIILNILESLDVLPEEDFAKAWLDFAKKRLLVGYAHRRGLQQPLPADREFIDHWLGMEKILDEVLDRFEKRYSKVYDHLDGMLSIKKPSKRDIKFFMESIPNNEAAHRYFFHKLDRPSWIDPLLKGGAFKNPQNKGRWPESAYLAKMAGAENLDQNTIAAIHRTLATIPDTPNEWVHSDLTECAIHLPANKAIDWAQREVLWIEEQSQFYTNLPYHIGELIEHLSIGEKADVALELAQKILAVRADPQLTEKLEEEKANPPREDEFHLPFYPEPQTIIDKYIYEKILEKHLPPLIESTGLAAFGLLCNLLIDAIQHSMRPGDSKDYSWIWRPSIEDSEHDVAPDIKYPLFGAVRDAAKMIAKNNTELFGELMNKLESDELSQWSIFQRLALYLLQVFPDTSSDYVTRYLHNKDLFDSQYVEHEYWQLAQARFGELDKAIQEGIIGWVLEQEDDEREAIKKRYIDWHDREPTAEEMTKFMHQWLRDELAPIKEFLPGEVRKLFDEAVQVVGEKEPSKLLPYQIETSWVGPTSPLTAEQMAGMTVDELIQHMNTWEPPGQWNSPTLDGYARMLEEVVGNDPNKYSPHCRQLIDLRPTFIRGFIEGFHHAAREDRPFDWESVLQLCTWIIEQEREFGPEIMAQATGDDREETNWGWTLKRIANLLEKGFKEKQQAEIPYHLRELAWSVLEALTHDPEPEVDGDKRFGESQDPATYSINTVRGQAMHTVMFYIMWVRRNYSKERDVPTTDLDFQLVLESVNILNAHLDIAKEPTLTIRSVYGRWFPWLVTWDKEWAKNHVSAIFPDAPELQDFWDTAWGTYVVYNRPYNNVFPILREQYERAFTRLGKLDVSIIGGRSPDESLARHIILLYGRGLITFEEDDLVGMLFDGAGPELRAHALSFVSETLGEADPPEVLNRFKDLWTWRLKTASVSEEPNEFVNEMASFGSWVASGRFEAQWIIENLLAVLKLTGKVHANERMVSQVATMAPEYPAETVEAYRLMVESKPEYWDMYDWQKPGKGLLQVVIKGDNEEAKLAATDLVNQLVAAGHLGYRDVLKGLEDE